MKQFRALLFVFWNLLALIFDKFLGLFQNKPSEKSRFLNNFQHDGLWSLTPQAREEIYSFSGCTQCGLCDSIIERHLASSPHPARHASPQEVIVGASRHLPTLQLTEDLLTPYQDQLKQLEQACPARIPFRTIYQLAQSTRNQAK